MSQLLLHKEDALVGADLTPAYQALKQDVAVVSAMFRKKEDINKMAKSILKHRIQTLTGRSMKIIEEEMNYKPLDPNETGMNEQVLRKLAHCLVLQANGDLPPVTADRTPAVAAPAPAPAVAAPDSSRKRPANGLPHAEAKPPKSARRSIAVVTPLDKPSEMSSLVGTPKRAGRRSLAVTSSSSGPLPPELDRPANPTPGRASRKSRLDESVSSEASVALRCPGPAATQETKLAVIQYEEEEDEAEDEEIPNPTPLMRELMQKRKSMAATAGGAAAKRSPAKAARSPPAKTKKATAVAVPPPSPGPRPEFIGTSGSRVYLMRGQPLELNLSKVRATLPLSANFPGAHLTVVHTPAEFTPTELFLIGKMIKTLNMEAGLASFVLLVGTGLINVHLNMEALKRHTQHVQFLTFHREDANKGVETGLLRETTSHFLAGYFFPGCEAADSSPPTKMVRDNYTTCFRTDGIEHLEKSIIDCFSEPGEWLLDLYCGTRKLSLAAAEAGRNAVAVHHDPDQLDEVGNYLRTLSIESDPTYRVKDGLVL